MAIQVIKKIQPKNKIGRRCLKKFVTLKSKTRPKILFNLEDSNEFETRSQFSKAILKQKYIHRNLKKTNNFRNIFLNDFKYPNTIYSK